MIKLVRQPEDSVLCGQACVAMLANVTLDDACRIIGHKRRTTTKQIINALKHYGIDCKSNRLIPIRPTTKFKTAIIKMKPLGWGTRRNWHWQLWHEGSVLDSHGSVTAGLPSSYLQVE